VLDQSHDSDSQGRSGWSDAAKIIASLAIGFHLFAVFVGPWSYPPPSTQLSRDIAEVLSPYIKFMALDNGYRFFAPDPGPSHLIRYELRMPDGSKRSETFPNLERHWPRLLYHRHFMLSETIYGIASPLMDAPSAATMPPDERAAFQRQQRQAELLKQGVANYLLKQYPEADRVRLFTRIHTLPSPADVLGGRPLDDPDLYQEFLLGEFSR
jgi:hypothetical protein